MKLNDRMKHVRRAWGFFQTKAEDYRYGMIGPAGAPRWPITRLGPSYCPHLRGLALDWHTNKPLEAPTRAKIIALAREFKYYGRPVRITVTTRIEKK